jgi:uncharacterized protein
VTTSRPTELGLSEALDGARSRPDLLDRLAYRTHREYPLVLLAVGAIAVHFVAENFLQPQPGTSAGDHLVSGLVPIAVLAVVAAAYPRLRAGARAATALVLGALGIAVGLPGAYYLVEGNASGSHYTGLLAILAGLALIATAPVTLWKARRSRGSRRRRYLRRSLTVVAAVAAAWFVFWWVVFPIGLSYVYTHTGPTPSTPSVGQRVTLTTSDSLDLAAWYAPSRNRAAVIVFPGPARAEEARMLVRHGYGALLLEPRGQGSSEGDAVRWAGDRDLLAGVAYLRSRPDVDPDRIGGFGFSVGGETLLEAAAQSTGFRAIVSEGAGERVGEQDADGASRFFVAPMQAAITAATTVFANHGPPPPIVDRIGRIAPRPVFLIYADPGMGGESTRQPKYYAAAGEPKAIWRVPGAEHTGGIDARPAEYEQRVIGFFDRALLETR